MSSAWEKNKIEKQDIPKILVLKIIFLLAEQRLEKISEGD
jgi:hypothetical protein